MYKEKVFEHFTSPRNVGHLENADGTGTVGDPSCGDYLRIYIKVKYHRIVDIKFEIMGCPAAIATSSILTEMVKGMSLDEAWMISDEDVLSALGGLPEHKEHCSNLSTGALKEAINNYVIQGSGNK